MSITEKLTQLAAARAQVAALQATVEAELQRELAALPAQYGFTSAAAFIAAVTKAAGKPRGRKPAKTKAVVASVAAKPATPVAPKSAPVVAAAAAPAKPAAPAKKERRKRTVITAAMRAQVKKLVKAGKSGAQIAQAVGISLPSVHNVKKALGLVKKK